MFLAVSGRSTATISQYLSVLRRWIDVVLDPFAVTKPQVNQWIISRRGNVSVSTFNLDLYVLRSYYRWAFKWGYACEDLSGMLPSSHRAPPRRITRYLTEFQMGQLLAAQDRTTFIGYRDHLIIRLIYETGLRATEIINLQLGSIQDDRTVLVLSGKGGKDRLVPFSEEMDGLLKAWYSIRRTVKPGKSYTLFVTQKGHAFRSGRSIWELINRYAQSALGLGRGFETLIYTSSHKPWSHFYPHCYVVPSMRESESQ